MNEKRTKMVDKIKLFEEIWYRILNILQYSFFSSWRFQIALDKPKKS
jgi:hypothetical protein